jgi:hypothetical protein
MKFSPDTAAGSNCNFKLTPSFLVAKVKPLWFLIFSCTVAGRSGSTQSEGLIITVGVAGTTAVGFFPRLTIN